MQLGIFAKTFVRPSLEATLDAVASHGLSCVQFNMACVGLPTLPEAIAPAHHAVWRRGRGRDRAGLSEALVLARLIVVRSILGKDPVLAG